MPYYLLRDDELAVVEESPYGTSSNPVGADFFKHTSTTVQIVHSIEEYFRDRDRDSGQASVIGLQTGRAKSAVTVEADLVPSGVSATPTAPDMDLFWKALLGAKSTLTAHTTTAAGSAGTSLNLTTGGGAASGIPVAGGCLIAVDVDADNGVEVRRVVSRSTDTVTIDRAFTVDPAAGRNVYVGTTYSLSSSAAASLALYTFNGAEKYKVPGLALQEGEVTINFADGVPVARVRFSGEAQPETVHAVSRPTPTTAGSPLAPSVGKVWLGATKYSIVQGGFVIRSGYELRNNESGGLTPTGIKRTGNNSRFNIEQTLELYLTDTTSTFYTGGKSRTTRDAIVQLGNAPGAMIAWCTQNWRARAERTELDGELGLRLTGRALGVTADDEILVTVF